MVNRDGVAEGGFREQMIDALVFSLAVYETAPERILSVLKYKYDLPVGALELLHLEGSVSEGIPFCSGGKSSHPVIVGRSTHGHVVVSCRGTADFSDLIQDLKIIPKWMSCSNGGAAAHMGFVERAESVDLQPFLSLLSKGEKIVFTGHSLGGAVSSLLALRVLEAAEEHNICTHLGQVQCITFGCPLFASPTLANCINERYSDRFCHVVSRYDLIPRIVPLVRMAQNLVGNGSHDALEAIRLARMGLEAVESFTNIPLASVFRQVECLVPAPLRTLMGNAVRFFWPQRSAQQYAFAGKFLFVDPLASNEESAVKICHGEELNGFHSEMAFAMGLNMNVMEHHGLSHYEQGLVKGLRSRLLAHFHKKRVQAMDWPEFGDASEIGNNKCVSFSSPQLSFQPRRSVDLGLLKTGFMAAAAVEAATITYRSAKIHGLRQNMERKFADCAAALNIISDQSFPAYPCQQRKADWRQGGASLGTVDDGFVHYGNLSRFPSRNKVVCWADSKVARAISHKQELQKQIVPKKEGPLCCTFCRLKVQRAMGSGESRVRLDELQATPSDGSVAAQGLKRTGSLRKRIGLFFRVAFRVAQLARSFNVFTLSSCAIRFFLGSPLF